MDAEQPGEGLGGQVRGWIGGWLGGYVGWGGRVRMPGAREQRIAVRLGGFTERRKNGSEAWRGSVDAEQQEEGAGGQVSGWMGGRLGGWVAGRVGGGSVHQGHMNTGLRPGWGV